ncbi:MAG: YihY/virulence factor BrkB family protein [Acetatifactor sp.]
MLQKLYLLLRNFSLQMRKKNISSYAASIAFFFFLSIGPMLIMICTIIPYTPLTEQHLVEAVTDVVPKKIVPLAVSLISDVYEKSAGIMSIAIIATIWSAAKGVMALMRALNAINDVEEKRNYFVLRGVASLYTLVMLIVVILSLFLNVFGNQLVRLILYRLPVVREFVFFLMHFRFIFVWAVLTLLFASVYAYLPNEKLNFKEQIPGAMFAAVVWNLFSWGFSIYVSYSNSYGIYGSMSIIIIVLLWMYFCMYIVMIGAYLNQYFRPINKVLANSIGRQNK